MVKVLTRGRQRAKKPHVISGGTIPTSFHPTGTSKVLRTTGWHSTSVGQEGITTSVLYINTTCATPMQKVNVAHSNLLTSCVTFITSHNQFSRQKRIAVSLLRVASCPTMYRFQLLKQSHLIHTRPKTGNWHRTPKQRKETSRREYVNR